MLAWQANMDIQFVLNAYACVMYVASYVMSELLKRVAELKNPVEKSWFSISNPQRVECTRSSV